MKVYNQIARINKNMSNIKYNNYFKQRKEQIKEIKTANDGKDEKQ